MKDYEDIVQNLIKSSDEILKTLTPDQLHLLHVCVGLSGEVGELLDLIKKMVVYSKFVSRDDLINEMGDVEFYLQALRTHTNISREQAINANVQKLKKRYPDFVYSNDDAIARVDASVVERSEPLTKIDGICQTIFKMPCSDAKCTGYFNIKQGVDYASLTNGVKCSHSRCPKKHVFSSQLEGCIISICQHEYCQGLSVWSSDVGGFVMCPHCGTMVKTDEYIVP